MYIGTLSTKTHIYASVKHRLFCFCTLQVLLKVDGKANKLHVTSGTVLGSSYAYRQDTYKEFGLVTSHICKKSGTI